MAPRKTNNSKKGTAVAEIHNMSVGGASNYSGTIANRNSNDIGVFYFSVSQVV